MSDSKQDEYSPLRFIIELKFVNALSGTKWYEFGKRRKITKERDEKLKKHGFPI